VSKGSLTLTEQDLKLLAGETSAPARIRLAENIARHYNVKSFNETEEKIAQEIFRLLMKDNSVEVRFVLSESLKENMVVPHDIIIGLAKDSAAEVASPVLQYSFVLTEEDLFDIARDTRELQALQAIAQRETLSAPVSGILIAKDEPRLLQTLVSNGGASIREQDLQPAIERLAGQDELLEAILRRSGFSQSLKQQVLNQASEKIRDGLVLKYNLSPEMTVAASGGVRELVALGLVPPGVRPSTIAALVHELHEQQRLTFSLVLRALSMGQLSFFEHAMAKLANIPVLNARLLIADPSGKGFESLYSVCGLPMDYFPTIRTLLEIVVKESNYGRMPREIFFPRMVEKIRTKQQEKHDDKMDFVNAIISQAVRDASASA
jgi:uncharacterized protein (DUF2336 family)